MVNARLDSAAETATGTSPEGVIVEPKCDSAEFANSSASELSRECGIVVEDAVLRYPLAPYQRGSLKLSVMSLLGARERAAPLKYVDAVRSVSLEIGHGQRVGLIGHNGAGKSSFLKMLAGVFPIQSGRIKVHGRIGTLLDVGLGFETESTGRENIYNRGYAMGMSRKALQKAEKDIIAFADLGEFIDLPMRTYSTGMYVRLGFAISTEFTPDILLIDEVFGAGDMKFAQRARDRMLKIANHAGIVVMVSHDTNALLDICERIVWLEHGQIVLDGPAREVIEKYLKTNGAAPALNSASD